MNHAYTIWRSSVYHIVHVHDDDDGPWPSLCGAHMFTSLETKTPGSAPCEKCLLAAKRIIEMAAPLVPVVARLEAHPFRNHGQGDGTT